MKISRYLIIPLLFITFTTNVFPLSVFNEAEYTDTKADIYFYANTPSFLSYCKRYGISIDDISFLADDSINDTGRNLIKNIAPGILDVLVVINTEKMKNNKGFIIFVKEDGSLFSMIKTNSSIINPEQKGVKIYQPKNDRDIVFIRKDNLTIIGDRDEIQSYINTSRLKKKNGSQYLKTARAGSINKTYYMYIGFTGHLKNLFSEAMQKGKKLGSSLDHNVYLKSLYNLESITGSAVLGKTAMIHGELRGGSDIDGERLMMFSHFIIVGSSFIMPFAEMLSRSFGKTKIKTDEKNLIKIQEFFGRMRTQQIKKGVSISFNFTEDETRLIAQGLKKKVSKKRTEVARKKHQRMLDDFFSAIKSGDISKIQSSLDKLKDINILNKGETPLYFAVKNGSIEPIRFLIKKGADINKKSGRDNLSPLTAAISYNRLKAAELLIEKGADLSVQDTRGYTLMHLAADEGSPSMIRLLVKNKLNVNAVATGNITPLHIAADNGNLEVVRALIESGADKDIKDLMGSSALDKAAAENHERVVEYLKNLSRK